MYCSISSNRDNIYLGTNNQRIDGSVNLNHRYNKIIIDHYEKNSCDIFSIKNELSDISLHIPMRWIMKDDISTIYPVVVLIPGSELFSLPIINFDFSNETLSLCQDYTRIRKIPKISININSNQIFNQQWTGHNHIWFSRTLAPEFLFISYHYLYIFFNKAILCSSLIFDNNIHKSIDMYHIVNIDQELDENSRIDCSNISLNFNNTQEIMQESLYIDSICDYYQINRQSILQFIL